ncbi:Oxoglutarate/iron-dependent dioxygenase [Parasponia andersonii]|uniref:Oxoglutarate/iron-dependent dioxygenase n=1 Tax=Parasponia andersonii TaxID=3476 RepID=A0A2P5CNK6_PARAD|nr:Oxoglutarate/iron-dependent dioxygenase [Parasponia andersonii]
MEKLVSGWSTSRTTLPESYIFPLETRPGELHFGPDGNSNIPVIDLDEDHNHDQTSIIQQIIKAGQEYGIFQVVNHGVSEELMDETMKVTKEFHEMPDIDKARECSKDPKMRCRLYTSSENYSTEQLHYWRDALVHPCHPLEEHMQFWPENPTQYREIVGKYTEEVRKLASKILELISQGLRVKPGYFSGELSENPIVLVNHYPACPEPGLALGIAKHCDPSVITILLQGDVPGLQLCKDGKWVVVPPLSHAFVVNIGYVLQVMSNGKLKGAEHRVVTNSSVARTTTSLFIYPSNDSIIKPETTLTDACNPPLYRAVQYKDFRSYYISNAADAEKVHEFMDRHT